MHSNKLIAENVLGHIIVNIMFRLVGDNIDLMARIQSAATALFTGHSNMLS